MSNGTKPKFYVDENLPQPVAGCLQTLLRGAEFHNSHDVTGGDGTKDVDLMKRLREEHYDFFITQDLKQMTIPQERDAVREAGLSWIGVPHMERRVKGRELAAAQIAVLSPVAAHLLQQPPEHPMAYFLTEARSFEDVIRHSEGI